jgi:beta-glucoside operon transcriptional antiterminator
MKIAKVLNNNIAIAVGRDGNDVIVLGSGIAFQKHRGDEVDESRIERIFTQHVSELSLRLSEMVQEIPEEYFEAVRKIVDDAKIELGKDLDDPIYLSLTDHIHFAIQRIEEGIPLHNRLLLETKMIYRDEFRVAARAVNYLDATFNVKLPEDEIAFIALHLVNASLSSSSRTALVPTIR